MNSNLSLNALIQLKPREILIFLSLVPIFLSFLKDLGLVGNLKVLNDLLTSCELAGVFEDFGVVTLELAPEAGFQGGLIVD